MSGNGSVVVIGNFDGVHRGHQAVLAQARAIADSRGLSCRVLTFDPHPREVLGGGARPKLATLERRIALLRRHGADEVVVQPFTRAFAGWEPERFVRELLVGQLGARAVVVGENFRFGAKRGGDLALLGSLGEELGFQAVSAEIAGDEAGVFSSTRAREAIARGDLAEASLVLGRPHTLTGTVEPGDRLGRTIGFPTANLGGVLEMLPPYGVYAIRVRGAREQEAVAGVMNVGVRPTVSGDTLRIEAHLLDFEGDLYGKRLAVELALRLREERRFDGLPALRAQIGADVAAARLALAAP